MNFLPHILFGLFFFTAVLYFVGYFNTPPTTLTNLYKLMLGYFIVLTSALVPDIDHRQSIIFKVFNVVIGVLLFVWVVSAYGFHLVDIGLYLLTFALWYLVVSKIIIPKHRGFIHSLSFLAIFTVVIYLLTQSLFLTGAAFSGFFSHLLLDRCIKLW